MRTLFVITLLMMPTACMQTQNSNSLDKDTFGNAGGLFGAAQTIMGTNCTPCHDYGTRSEVQLIASGLIVAGDPENSKLYYRLNGSGGSKGPKNMPQNGSLSDTQIEAIRDWILSQ